MSLWVYRRRGGSTYVKRNEPRGTFLGQRQLRCGVEEETPKARAKVTM